MNERTVIREERISADEYIVFLKRTDLGSQYPKERFEERIGKLVKNVSISLAARDDSGKLVGALFGLTDFAYWLYVTDIGVDRDWVGQGIGTQLMKKAHDDLRAAKSCEICIHKNHCDPHAPYESPPWKMWRACGEVEKKNYRWRGYKE